jgi:hypothetical protein
VKPIAIFDVDGTLVDIDNIRHLAAAGSATLDLDRFHELCGQQPARQWVLDYAVRLQECGVRVVVATYRPSTHAAATGDWLLRHGIPASRLYSRTPASSAPPAEWKRRVLGLERLLGEVVLAVDDDPSVLAMYERERVPALRVPGWPG